MLLPYYSVKTYVLFLSYYLFAVNTFFSVPEKNFRVQGVFVNDVVNRYRVFLSDAVQSVRKLVVLSRHPGFLNLDAIRRGGQGEPFADSVDLAY